MENTPITDMVREREGPYLEAVEELETSHAALAAFVGGLDRWHHLLPSDVQEERRRLLLDAASAASSGYEEADEDDEDDEDLV